MLQVRWSIPPSTLPNTDKSGMLDCWQVLPQITYTKAHMIKTMNRPVTNITLEFYNPNYFIGG